MLTPRTFDVDGNVLTGGIARPPQEPTAIAVLCHGTPSGYPDEPGDRGYAGFADELAAEGIEAWWFNFRGARDSAGIFTFEGWVTDLLGVLSQIQKGILPLYVVGASAGGGVALTAASRSQLVDGVATLACPAIWERHDEDMFEEALRIGTIPPDAGLHPDPWWQEFHENQPIDHVAALNGRPVLILHGDQDDAVPVAHAESLFGAAGEPKQLGLIKGAGHQLRRNPEVIRLLSQWMRDCAGRKSAG